MKIIKLFTIQALNNMILCIVRGGYGSGVWMLSDGDIREPVNVPGCPGPH
jgi:hypothetical protein